MLFALYLAIFSLCLWKIRFSNETGAKHEFLFKPRTESIKGIFILLIVISHANGYIKDVGYLYNQPGDQWFLLVIDKLKQLVVVMFLFYSGYGVGLSINKKGLSYVQSMPKRRILTTLLNLDVAVVVFIVLNLLLGIELNAQQCLLSLIGWSSLGNSNWYIFCILLCYGFSYIASLATKNRIARCLIIFAFSCFAIIALQTCKESWWYDTLLSYPLGFTIALYRESFLPLLKRYYFSAIAVVVSLFVALTMWDHEYYGFRFNAISMLYALIVLLLTMKLQIHNPALEWFGRHLFPIYMYMRLPMIIVDQKSPTLILNYPALFICIAFIATVIIAYYFKFWQIKL